MTPIQQAIAILEEDALTNRIERALEVLRGVPQSSQLSPDAIDKLCLEIQQGEMGWANGADFEDDCCACRECEAQRNEARNVVRGIASALASPDTRPLRQGENK